MKTQPLLSCLFCAALLSICASPSAAQLAPTSGLTIEDSPTLGAGNMEFSMGYSDCLPDGSFGIILAPGPDYSMRWRSLSAGVVIGLRDGVDLLSEMQYGFNSRRTPTSSNVQGPGDMRIGIKMALWSHENATSLSWVNSLGLPLRRSHEDDELSPTSNSMGSDQLLVLSHAAKRYAATLQGGVHYGYDAGAGPRLLLHVAAGAGYQVFSRIQPRLETHAEGSVHGGPVALSATAGVIVMINEQLRADLGLQLATVGEAAWRERTLVIRLVFAP